jgi:hypothetical protein
MKQMMVVLAANQKQKPGRKPASEGGEEAA